MPFPASTALLREAAVKMQPHPDQDPFIFLKPKGTQAHLASKTTTRNSNCRGHAVMKLEVHWKSSPLLTGNRLHCFLVL